MTNQAQDANDQTPLSSVGQKAIIKNSDDHILLLQRLESPGEVGKWTLPGSILKKGEDPLGSIQIEIATETQLLVTDIKPFYLFKYKADNGDVVVMIGYTCEAQTDEVGLNWEYQSYKWIETTKALEMDLTDHARIFLTEYGKLGS